MQLRTDDFDYSLPRDLIAQQPQRERAESRLMLLDRRAGSIRHHHVADLPRLLRAGDALVLNRSRVIPARLKGHKTSGGEIELLLLRAQSGSCWIALARPARRLRPETLLRFDGSPLTATMGERLPEGEWEVQFAGAQDVPAELNRIGTLPLPPYITSASIDPTRYQTVYADRDGSIAAPTAGLHFSACLLDELSKRQVRQVYVTLHVGPGTFRPVTVENVADHRMHPEWGEISAESASTIRAARAAGGRTIAVGTTSVRLLESVWREGNVEAWNGLTDRFIYPGYRFQAVDAMMTNFHLPRSTLLMLVSAFAGHEFIMEAYAEAIRQRYRFYSFGDAMLIV